MNDENVPVLIIGGGSVGVAAALFLSRLGVKVLLVERHTTTSIHPRARGINYRTLEIFRAAGLEAAIREAGSALAKSNISLLVNTLAGKEIRRFGGLEDTAESRARLAQFTPTTWCLCAQDELEPLLATTAQTYGAEIRFNHELMSFAQTAGGVTATILDRTTGNQYTVRAAYMLATDGGNSPVRRSLEISETGRGALGFYVGIYFRADLSELVQGREFVMCFVKNAEAPGTIASVNNRDRWVFNAEYEPTNGITAADFTPERCIELVRKAVGVPDLEVELLSVLPWEAAVRVADRYQVGRVFLAGDAVHVMPPAGAFGMNTGIQDVHNLAWKLAMVLKGQAAPTLLATYEAERRPVGKFTAEQAGLRMDFRGGGGRPKPDAEANKPKLIDDLTMILGYRYPTTVTETVAPFSDELVLSGEPGTRAPHIWLEKAGQLISTLDLFDQHFVLLAGEEGRAWVEAAPKVATQRGIVLDSYRIGETGDLKDPEQSWYNSYGVTPTGAVLVRPDGFVAWRSVSSPQLPEQTFVVALDAILNR